MSVQEVRLPEIGDSGRGYLAVLENKLSFDVLPFDILRSYWIYEVPENVMRGGHAHRDANQAFVCLKGKVLFHTKEVRFGSSTEEYTIEVHNWRLVTPRDLLIVPRLIWHTMEFLEKDSILLAFASTRFREDDYIREYEDWIHFVKQVKGPQAKREAPLTSSCS